MVKEHQITTKWKNEKQPIYISIDILMSDSMFIHICIYSSLTLQILKREFQTEESKILQQLSILLQIHLFKCESLRRYVKLSE